MLQTGFYLIVAQGTTSFIMFISNLIFTIFFPTWISAYTKWLCSFPGSRLIKWNIYVTFLTLAWLFCLLLFSLSFLWKHVQDHTNVYTLEISIISTSNFLCSSGHARHFYPHAYKLQTACPHPSLISVLISLLSVTCISVIMCTFSKDHPWMAPKFLINLFQGKLQFIFVSYS